MKTYKAKVDLFGTGSANAETFSECGAGRRWAEKCALYTLQTVFDEATSINHLDALSVQATGSALEIDVRTEGSLRVSDEDGRRLKIATDKWTFNLDYSGAGSINARLWTSGYVGYKQVPLPRLHQRTLDNRKTTVDMCIMPDDDEQPKGPCHPEIYLYDVTKEAFESVQEHWCTAYGRNAVVEARSFLSEQEEVAS
tara:strand:+ start:506 stop:1096 length:591 start_codon:yes stop_codon:yes gene_type:complete